MSKRNMVGGPEWHKACGECDGQIDKKFRVRWRAWRRSRRAPLVEDWTDAEWNAMHDGCPPEFLRGVLLPVVKPWMPNAVVTEGGPEQVERKR